MGNQNLSPWGTSFPVILASQSPTRSMLLKNAGVRHTCVSPDIDERAIKNDNSNLGGADLAQILARAKAKQVGEIYRDAYVLGADQILVCGQHMFDKPLNRETAHRQISALQGRTHELISAAVIFHCGNIIWKRVEKAQLSMRKLSSASIEAYLERAGEDVYYSVGGYHLEGVGVQLFERIEGDYFTILGLPLLAILSFLRTRDIFG